MGPVFLVRPCSTSETITPVNANGSFSWIIRRSSAAAGPGDELKKSTQTELSTRIKRDFSGTLPGFPSKHQFRSSGECLFEPQTGREVPKHDPRSGAWS